MKHFFALVLPLLLITSITSSVQAETSLDTDAEAIRAHLSHVEETLRERETPDLTDAQRQARAQNLDALGEYWRAGVFPKNTVSTTSRLPIFIDDEGRSCAMAYLLMADGHADDAYEVAARENYAYLPDMTSPALGAWLARSGLTADEAAWIQPTYAPPCQCACEPTPVCSSTSGRTYPNACTAVLCGREVVEDLVTGCCASDSFLEYGAGAAGSSTDFCNTDQSFQDESGSHCSDNFDENVEPAPVDPDDARLNVENNGMAENNSGIENNNTAENNSTAENNNVFSGNNGDGPGTGSDPPKEDDEDAGCAVAPGAPNALPMLALLALAAVLVRRRA